MKKPLPYLLVIAGTLPCLAATVSLVAGGPLHPTVSIVMLVTYVAVVLSFLGGIQWGIALSIHDTAPQSANRLFILSIIPALLGWGSLWLNSPSQQLGAGIVVLALAWTLDALLRVRDLLPAWYFRLRGVATLIVGVSLAAALAKLIL